MNAFLDHPLTKNLQIIQLYFLQGFLLFKDSFDFLQLGYKSSFLKLQKSARSYGFEVYVRLTQHEDTFPSCDCVSSPAHAKAFLLRCSSMVSFRIYVYYICNGWNGQLPLARLRIVVPV